MCGVWLRQGYASQPLVLLRCYSAVKLGMAACCCGLNFRNRFKKDSASRCRFPGEFGLIFISVVTGWTIRGSIPGTNKRLFFHFHIRLKPALGATSSPIQWIPVLSSFGGKTAGVVKLATHLLLVQRLGMSEPVPFLLP